MQISDISKTKICLGDCKPMTYVPACLYRDSADLPEIFEALERSRQGLGLIAYSLSQATTLERVFVNLASTSGQ
jgi:hypothetical protein